MNMKTENRRRKLNKMRTINLSMCAFKDIRSAMHVAVDQSMRITYEH